MKQPPKLRNDCFALPPGVDWTPVDAALEALRARCSIVAAIEAAPLATACGRVLAAPPVAQNSSPPATNSAVDGYAFAHASLAGADPEELTLAAGRSAAGAPYPDVVPPGGAVRILTGGVMPDGADTVVLQEDVAVEGDIIRLRPGLRRGANSRWAGEDAEAGAEMLCAGHILRPQDLAQLAAVGVAEIQLRRRLRVAVLSTGDELVEAGAAAGPGAIHDSNRPMLLALAERWGFEAVDLGRVGDDPALVRAALDRGAAEADAILTTGGASAGDEDHVSAVLRAAGALSEWRIAMKPGRPLALAVWDGAAVFGLPGNPVAAFVCALIFARPALMAMAGAGWRSPRGLMSPAAFAKRRKPGRREYLRARLDAEGRVEIFGNEGSGLISSLVWADGLVDLPDDGGDIRAGDLVRYLPFSTFGL